jgi:hypothetical protein
VIERSHIGQSEQIDLSPAKSGKRERLKIKLKTLPTEETPTRPPSAYEAVVYGIYCSKANAILWNETEDLSNDFTWSLLDSLKAAGLNFKAVHQKVWYEAVDG